MTAPPNIHSYARSTRLGAGLLGLIASLLLPLGCANNDPTAVSRCGDGFCANEETLETCPRDCLSSCIPGEQRCQGNLLLVCQPDGVHEVSAQCQAGEFCTPAGCQTSPGPGPDLGPPPADTGLDLVEDVIEDPGADPVGDPAGDADDAGDLGTDSGDTGASDTGGGDAGGDTGGDTGGDAGGDLPGATD